eukprot:CAMPEP_0194286760 /NCGR_PEP_ID=MMETSP0169-20130528/33248_1 /TAXON_ID=218684 /ORGANISM="Corethron pennatum, Strain L29A3" /LENGTH=222 /DNA_ID=CAMNT_0039033273 /DNA_START=102 /DNA_END=770 /DNA_ORIENTATION=+
MGIFNDINAIDAFAINVYCIVSAFFFSACAYAQLNDPNPVQWFCAYVFGGIVPNLYWMTLTTNNKNSNNTCVTKRLVLALHSFVAIMGTAIVYKMITVVPKLLADVEKHHGLLWAFMEYEEGRDTCGLLLLIFHTAYLNSVIRRGPSIRWRSGNAGSNGSSSSSIDPPVPMIVSPAILSLGLLFILGVSVYVWVVHHPELVAKYGLKHCQGEMFGLGGGDDL